jgi:Na+/melibiose symporter-like transporter
MVDLRLFRSARFTWGTILQAFGIFAMFGLLFAAPQFFQAILGVTAMGSGLRLLPLMVGLAAGAGLADRVAQRLTTKLTAALGFALMTAGLVLGATMTTASGDAFIATWTAISGLGFGLALATAAATALVDLPKQNAGVGSAVMQAVQKTGAPLSAAILGSVLAAGYQSQLHLASLPAATADAVRNSVFAGLAVAGKLGSASLAHMVRSAFVHGIDALLWVSAGLAVVGVILALAFLPWRGTSADTAVAASRRPAEGEESAHERIA